MTSSFACLLASLCKFVVEVVLLELFCCVGVFRRQAVLLPFTGLWNVRGLIGTGGGALGRLASVKFRCEVSILFTCDRTVGLCLVLVSDLVVRVPEMGI